MDDFSRRPAGDRRVFFQESAARRDVTDIVIEKDFWVCWTLRRLFSDDRLAPFPTFKGGTSLSKVFGVIDRFSEDIDLTIARDAPFVADVLPPMEEGISKKERERRTKALKSAAQRFVAEVALEALGETIAEVLGRSDHWQLILDEEDPDQQTLLFHYPRTSGYGLAYGQDYGGAGDSGYIKPRIKLEFGARGEAEPAERHSIRPYVAEDFPDQFSAPDTDVVALAVERTYWEKVTILHALAHNGRLRSGMSRHYFDVMMLDRAGITDRALALPDLLERVVANKSMMFPDTHASYETAVFGSLVLQADGDTAGLLAKDYEAMADMFMNEPPTLEELRTAIASIEATLNRRQSH